MRLLALIHFPTRNDVLAEYGRTMGRVQQFESSVLFIHHLFHLREEARDGRPLTDDQFSTIFNEGKRDALSRRLNRWRKTAQGLGLPPLPSPTIDGLLVLTDLRNWLAHSYLNQNAHNIRRVKSRRMMMNELGEYAWAFREMDRSFSRMIDEMCEALGVTEDEVGLWEQDLVPVFRQVEFEKLTQRLRRIREEESDE